MQENLKGARIKKGVTQERGARLAGIPVSLWSRIENGTRCNQSTARKIAAALNEKPETVFPNYSKLRSW